MQRKFSAHICHRENDDKNLNSRKNWMLKEENNLMISATLKAMLLYGRFAQKAVQKYDCK